MWCAKVTAMIPRLARPSVHRPPSGPRSHVPAQIEGLRLAGRKLRRPALAIASEDHNTPTLDIDKPIACLTSRTPQSRVWTTSS